MINETKVSQTQHEINGKMYTYAVYKPSSTDIPKIEEIVINHGKTVYESSDEAKEMINTIY